MEKRLFLYDLENQAENLLPKINSEDYSFSAVPLVKHCIGCFGCWLKTPGQCVIKDRCAVMPSYIAQCRELIIISPILYGGYSQGIKAVLDRSIGYLLPYFRVVDGEMHHQMRYQNPFKLSVYFYGACSDNEKETARRLVKGNAVNLGAGSFTVQFFDSPILIKEALA